MDIEILKSILEISTDKHDTLMYFLSERIKERVEYLPLLVDDKIYLNDKIYCIGKNNLDLEYTGKVKHIDDKLSIEYTRSTEGYKCIINLDINKNIDNVEFKENTNNKKNSNFIHNPFLLHLYLYK